MVRAKLALLRQDFRSAEGIFLEQGQTDEAIEMYQMLHRWSDAIAVAEEAGHPDWAASAFIIALIYHVAAAGM